MFRQKRCIKFLTKCSWNAFFTIVWTFLRNVLKKRLYNILKTFYYNVYKRFLEKFPRNVFQIFEKCILKTFYKIVCKTNKKCWVNVFEMFLGNVSKQPILYQSETFGLVWKTYCVTWVLLCVTVWINMNYYKNNWYLQKIL